LHDLLYVLDVELERNGDAQFQEDGLNPKFSSTRSKKSVSRSHVKKVRSSSTAEKEEEKEEELPEIPFSRILALNKPEWCYMAGGKRVLGTCQIYFTFSMAITSFMCIAKTSFMFTMT